MSAPNFLVYEGDPSNGINPYRPGINDVGGAAKIDDQNAPPDPVTMPTAAEWNEFSLLLVAFAKVTGAALLYVTNAGTPAISGLRAASSIILTADFAIVDHGAGDTEITSPATKIMAPFACLAFPQAAGDLRASARLNGTGNGIRVETRNAGGTLTDCDFVVMWL